MKRGCDICIRALHLEAHRIVDVKRLREIAFELSVIASSLNINEIAAKDKIKELELQIKNIKERNYDK